MSDDRWQRIEAIFHQAGELAPEACPAFLDEACAGDESLRREVESLLVHDVEDGGTFANAVAEAASDQTVTPAEDLSGRAVGPYKLTGRIGEGGMGVVYRAVRASDFEKQVAVKLVKRGMDTDFILRRFRHERQILAALDHANIARILDGGATEDGRPYLVMEYVEGTPITEYSEQHALDVPARLRLFRTICSAVHYAHQRLVVHRDLKPGHILVTAEGVPKLLDFGIAKLLEADAEVTAPALRLLTPECASPEQVRGDPVTTASDVYSLGVLLYQLLTGAQPYRFTTRTAEEITRIICEMEPKRPSELRPLDKDLDNIVLKAMDKDPARRYASVEQFSEDVQRYLTGRPVLARTATFRYRTFKFVRRNRTASLAAGLLAVSLLGGLAATLWQAHIAQIERGRAERRFSDVRELANSLIFEIHDAVLRLPGATEARKLIVDRALRYLDKLAREAGQDPSLQDELADAYERLGDVQGGAYYGILGDSSAALASLRKARNLRQVRAAANPRDLPAQRRLARDLQRIIRLHMVMGKLVEALELQHQAQAIDQAIQQGNPGGGEDADRLAADFDLLGDLQGGNGPTSSLADIGAARESYRKALEMQETAVRSDPANVRWQSRAAVYTMKLGDALQKAAERKQALACYRRALTWWESPAANKTSDLEVMGQRGITHSRIAEMLDLAGDTAGALKHYQADLDILEPLLAADPRDAALLSQKAAAEANTGHTMVKMGRASGGMAHLDRAVGLLRRSLATDPANGAFRSQLAQTLSLAAPDWMAGGNPDTALAQCRAAQEIYQSLMASQPQDVDSRLNAADNLNVMAGILLRQANRDRAREAYRGAMSLAESFAVSEPGSEAARHIVADAYAGLGRVATAQANWREARSWFQRSLDMWGRVHNPGQMNPNGLDTEGPDAVRAELARCDAALAQSPVRQ